MGDLEGELACSFLHYLSTFIIHDLRILAFTSVSHVFHRLSFNWLFRKDLLGLSKFIQLKINQKYRSVKRRERVKSEKIVVK